MHILEDELISGIRSLPSFPVVLVTVGSNIMTAAAFHFYSFSPPCVMVGIIHSQYTNQLINEYSEFGINIPTSDMIEIIRICGSVSGKDGADKYKLAGITPKKAVKINSFLIEECPLSLECEVVHKVDFPGSHQWFVGEIKAVHRDENYKRDQALLFWGKEYHRVGEFLERA